MPKEIADQLKELKNQEMPEEELIVEAINDGLLAVIQRERMAALGMMQYRVLGCC